MNWSLVFSSAKCPEPERVINLARAAENAGFFPCRWPTERGRSELPEPLGVMRGTARAARRDPALIESTSDGKSTAEGACWFADHGARQLTAAVHARDDGCTRGELLRFGHDVISKKAQL